MTLIYSLFDSGYTSGEVKSLYCVKHLRAFSSWHEFAYERSSNVWCLGLIYPLAIQKTSFRGIKRWTRNASQVKKTYDNNLREGFYISLVVLCVYWISFILVFVYLSSRWAGWGNLPDILLNCQCCSFDVINFTVKATSKPAPREM